jgi:polyhydroxybutyrate depolymerase
MPRRTPLILITVLSLGACVGAQTPPAAPNPPPMAGPIAYSERSLVHDGLTRTWQVHDFSGGRLAPMVIVLHGGGGNAENVAEQTGFDAVAEREGLIVVYPNGTGGPLLRQLQTWNAGHCCAQALQNDVDDVGFISAMIDEMAANGRADPARIYVTGLSNGGMMTHRLGIEIGDKLAAIAPVIAGLFGDEPPPIAPLPVLIINGAEDRNVKGEGGPVEGIRAALGAAPADRDLEPAEFQAQYWAAAAACTAPRTDELSVALRISYQRCPPGIEVVQYVVRNNGHAWPGGTAPRAAADPPNPDFDASEVIWEFFARHSRAQ